MQESPAVPCQGFLTRVTTRSIMPFEQDIANPLEEEEEIIQEDEEEEGGDEQETDEEEDDQHDADYDNGEEEEHRDAEVGDVSQQQESDGLAAHDDDDDEETAEDETNAVAVAEQAVEDNATGATGAEDDVADVAVDSSTKALLEISQEKALIKFLPAPRDLFPNLSTTWWGKVRHLDWGHVNKQRRDLQGGIMVYPGLLRLVFTFDEEKASISNKYFPVARKVTICPMCFSNPVKGLLQCIITCGFNQKKKSINTSNIGAHFRRWHHGQDIPVYQESITCGGDADSVGGTARSQHSRQSTMATFAAPWSRGKSAALNRKAAVAAVKESIYRCVNDLNFPNSTVEKPVFREMLYTVKQYATSLQPTDLQLSNKAIIGLRVDSYNKQVFVISELVRKVRMRFEALCGKEVPFITICHDMWNGKKKEVLGVSIMFIDPRNCVLYKIPIGMLRVYGHSSADICEVTWSIMVVYGIIQRDLIASVNDNANTAILASKYITGKKSKGGKCDMHKADLMLKHATGLVTRSHDNRVIDANEPFMELYDTFLKFARWLMSKKAPARYNNLLQWCKKNSKTCIEISLPNKTRVAGCVITIQCLLRMKFIMGDYASQSIGGDAEFKAKFPCEDDWDLLSQFEAVLNPLQKLSMSLQQEDVGSASASLLEIFYCKKTIENMQEPLLTDEQLDVDGAIQGGLLVLSTRVEDYADSNHLWDGGGDDSQAGEKEKVCGLRHGPRACTIPRGAFAQ